MKFFSYPNTVVIHFTFLKIHEDLRNSNECLLKELVKNNELLLLAPQSLLISSHLWFYENGKFYFVCFNSSKIENTSYEKNKNL